MQGQTRQTPLRSINASRTAESTVRYPYTISIFSGSILPVQLLTYLLRLLRCFYLLWSAPPPIKSYRIQSRCNYISCNCIILGDPGAVSWGRAKWRDESFQERAKEPLGTKSHRTISKRLREYRLLIGQKKSLVLFCPIGEQQLSNHFRVFLHGDCCPAILVWFVHQGYACEGNFHFDFPYRR